MLGWIKHIENDVKATLEVINIIFTLLKTHVYICLIIINYEWNQSSFRLIVLLLETYTSKNNNK